ncbi:MAG TPA: (Fe-S)-binding protein [Deltaproteobacteria bacterium]|nr:(Fe-S)-binding protein [Deltaproteobacteria bacterium]
MTILSDCSEMARRCVRCGSCRSGCPAYGVVGREGASPRGRVALIGARAGGEDFGDAYLRSIRECTLCGSCAAACPRGVDVPSLVLAARAQAVERDGLPAGAGFVLNGLLGSPSRMGLVFRLASTLRGLVMKSDPSGGGAVTRFDLLGGRRCLPELPPAPFLGGGRAARREGPAGGEPKVGFFAGCVINYLLPRVGEASFRALAGAGASVEAPAGQLCCGMPALSLGDRETARSLALRNMEVFEQGGYDYVTTACATCTHALRGLYTDLFAGDGGDMIARAAAFSSRVMDITELLADVTGWGGGRGGAGGATVTYHDPCHLARYQGVKDQPRELIERSGNRFVEMRRPCSCCGLGGGLSLTNYRMSMEITREKVENIKDSGAQVVATACPGCMVQIGDGLHRFGAEAKVVHVVELL